MGWEVWSDTDSNRSYGQMGFFCNTADVSFGPVFMTDSYFDKSEFYKLWEQAGFKDPRQRDVTDSDISQQTRHILSLMSWDDNIIATMKVSRSDGKNAPILYFEQSTKDCFSNLDFSPFHEPLESLEEADFTTVEDLIMGANENMKYLILHEDPYDEDKKTSFKDEHDGFIVEMEWEVIDEYQTNLSSMFDVIVPIYRISEEFLLRALDSLKDQTMTDYTVYVCDGTPVEHQEYDAQAVVECYGFNYLRQDPAHPLVGGARNQAVAAGSNPYLAFLDGDDWWYDGYLAEMKITIEKSNEQTAIWSCPLDCHVPTISQFSGETFFVKGIYNYWPQQEQWLKDNPDYAYYFFFGHPPAPTGTIIRREAFEAVGGYDETMGMGEDTELLMRIVGDPRKIPVEDRRHYSLLDYIVGFHYIGEENTCSLGTQSGVAEGRDKDGIKAIFLQNMEHFTENHPLPTKEDMPDGTSDEFVETLKGVMRDRVINRWG